MRHPVVSLACVLVSMHATACGPELDDPSLENRTFLAQRVTEGGVERMVVEGTELRLLFREDPRVSASAGCNSMEAEYAIDDGIFELSSDGTSLVFCDAEIDAQEAWYFGFLESSPAITVSGDELVLEGDGTRIEYLDQEVANPDVELTGNVWIVDTIIQGDTASHAEWPDPAVLAFADDGMVAVDTGCNMGIGAYRLSGTEMTFSDVAVTERGCDGLTGELDAAVLAVVHGPQPVTWEITADRLSLRGANGGLDLVASGG
ncbi:META domain-containing protein [Paraliomyxa miuraensis]|uniref:META domain-containing protein n=1 Tax=Paraliomyxa miuraensis TaxID=376150 RepID=UPI002250BBE7|nr:META domain-containing protein [Paraliomyxa miuraensis]MCX4244101.1 META domain-containing protein [Paraliomyxa miuraensis]